MKSDEQTSAEVVRASAPYMTLGIHMAAAVTLFLFAGKYADEYFGTKPWLMIAGIVAGFAGGMIKFFRTVTQLSAQEDEERRKQ